MNNNSKAGMVRVWVACGSVAKCPQTSGHITAFILQVQCRY